MSHTISFIPHKYGWYSTYNDIDMWVYKSHSGWALIYSYNAISQTKAKLLSSDSVCDIMTKVLSLTGKEMRFTVSD